jgi:four helix bundle protein
MMHNYEKLTVWQKGMELAELIYNATKKFPKDETYGIVSQMRRAAVSIPSNIAEGSRRGTENYFKQFLQIAFGSAAELETQIKLSKRLGYLTLEESDKIENLLTEVIKMLYGLLYKNS